MFKVTILPLAKEDIKEAARWYNSKQKGLGKQFIGAVRNKILFVRKNPKAYAIRYDDMHCAILVSLPLNPLQTKS